MSAKSIETLQCYWGSTRDQNAPYGKNSTYFYKDNKYGHISNMLECFEELSSELNGLRWINKNTRLVERGKGAKSVVTCEAMGGEETECGNI